MPRGKYLSFPEGRKEGRLNQFARRHRQFKERLDAQERFDTLLQRMARKLPAPGLGLLYSAGDPTKRDALSIAGEL